MGSENRQFPRTNSDNNPNFMIDPDTSYYLQWRGKVVGPFQLEEINQKLRQRQINSLYKVQVEGDWVLLREFLAQIKTEHAEEEIELPTPPPLRGGSPGTGLSSSPPVIGDPSPVVPLAIPVEDDGWGGAALPRENPAGSEGFSNPAGMDKTGKGMGVSSFILSFSFFIPFLNLFGLTMSLILGHLALSRSSSGEEPRRSVFPWFGVMTSYVHMGFLVLAAAYVLGFLVKDAPSSMKITAFLSIHGMMLWYAVLACFGAGLLMLAVKMLAGYVPRFHICYVGALLPFAVGELVKIFVSSTADKNQHEMFVIWGIACLIMLVLQALVWAFLIKDDDGEPLGFTYASVASLFYTIVSLFIGLLFILLRTSLF
jgi:hypothetical protein